ncbi:MAG: low specificity L-threonine aldolase [Rhodospirillales bacterium]
MTASQAEPLFDFRSDNVWGASPEILAALSAASAGPAVPYGADDWSQRLEARLAEIFETELQVFPVATGSAANALALAAMSPPWGVVYCHQEAHVQVDECGAPEFFTGGAKLLPLPGEHGKLRPETLEAAVFGSGVVHHPQPAGVTLTQASECGTVYRPDEIAALSTLCRDRGLALHMDGARFANALVGLDATPAEMTWKAGIELLSFGGTKNGCLAAEALVVFKPALAESLGFRRKRAGHLFSKMRFLSAQLLAYLEDDLWLANARRANAAAQALAAALQAAGGKLVHPVEANEVFIELAPDLAQDLGRRGLLFLPWPAAGAEVYRFVTAFNMSVDSLPKVR